MTTPQPGSPLPNTESRPRPEVVVRGRYPLRRARRRSPPRRGSGGASVSSRVPHDSERVSPPSWSHGPAELGSDHRPSGSKAPPAGAPNLTRYLREQGATTVIEVNRPDRNPPDADSGKATPHDAEAAAPIAAGGHRHGQGQGPSTGTSSDPPRCTWSDARPRRRGARPPTSSTP